MINVRSTFRLRYAECEPGNSDQNGSEGERRSVNPRRQGGMQPPHVLFSETAAEALGGSSWNFEELMRHHLRSF